MKICGIRENPRFQPLSHWPETMINAIRNLPNQPLPSQAIGEGLLDGLDHVTRRVRALLSKTSHQAAE